MLMGKIRANTSCNEEKKYQCMGDQMESLVNGRRLYRKHRESSNIDWPQLDRAKAVKIKQKNNSLHSNFEYIPVYKFNLL